MARSRRSRKIPQSPCGCEVVISGNPLAHEQAPWRFIVPGKVEPPNIFFGHLFSPDNPDLPTPAYDPMLKEWFIEESEALPDPDRDAVICGFCDEPTSAIVGFDDVDIYREEAGLPRDWHFGWIFEIRK